MKLKHRVCALVLLFFSSTLFLLLLVLHMNEVQLQEDIKRQLNRLSVDWGEPRYQPATTTHSPLYPNECSIPTDIYSLCVEHYDMRPHKTCSLEKLSQDCDLLNELHGYDKPVEEEEKNFPLAFGIKMHTSPEQAEQLLRAIYRPHNVYCIHIDKKADDAVYRVMESIASCFDNVIITDRINFVYGSFDTIEAETILMTCALNSPVDFKYYLNLAGQEFPLRTNLEIVRVLRMLNGTNDIETFPIPDRYKGRVTHKFHVEKGKLVNTTIPKAPPTFKAEIRKGSQYSAFTKAFVEAWVTGRLQMPLVDFLKDAQFPEEELWATMNQLPGIPGGYPFKVEHNPGNQHISRTVAWQWYDKYKCRGDYVREVCIFTRADLPWLLQQPNLFANKFRWDMDPQSVACLEAVLDQRARARRSTLDYLHFLSLPHIQYRNKDAKPSIPFTTI